MRAARPCRRQPLPRASARPRWPRPPSHCGRATWRKTLRPWRRRCTTSLLTSRSISRSRWRPASAGGRSSRCGRGACPSRAAPSASAPTLTSRANRAPRCRARASRCGTRRSSMAARWTCLTRGWSTAATRARACTSSSRARPRRCSSRTRTTGAGARTRASRPRVRGSEDDSEGVAHCDTTYRYTSTHPHILLSNLVTDLRHIRL
mmetsp:Transcript_12147/g.38372  ORF Transcript_12147/g.38372 Transcript_12147/m.38372 type:complete len:206 (-) Transcript_12147:217-834(-)